MFENSKTQRGFDLCKFKDRYDVPCSIQKSSIATEDCIWLGVDDADPKIMGSKVRDGLTGWVKYPVPEDVLLHTRMHLSVDNVRDLIPMLQRFVDTGELTTNMD